MELRPLTDHLSSLTTMVVCGTSMRPFFCAGEMVVVQGMPVANIQKGSVVLFVPYDGGPHVMHRVVNIVDENGVRRFLCQGDNRSRPDGFVDEGQIIAKVIGRYQNRRFKPFRTGHEAAGLILSRCYRRVKDGVKKIVIFAWPFLSRWTRKVAVHDSCGQDRQLVFAGWRGVRFNRNFSRFASVTTAED